LSLSGLPGMTQEELKQYLSELYFPDCSCEHEAHDLADDQENPEDLAFNMVMQIWRSKQMPHTIDEDMTNYYAKQFMEAVQDGFGIGLSQVDYDTPDYMMLRKLKDNVFHFSAAKNYQQLKSLSQALLNDEGKLRTFSEFKQAAYEINNEHVNQWLKAEYNMAICTGQASADWTRYEENKDIMPNLEFDAVIDGRTTDLCRSLNGIVRPIDDPFWDIYYIPNHWGERATIRQIKGGKLTPHSDIIPPEKMPDMFKTNLAKNGLAFPPGHPYYIGLPEQVKEKAQELSNNYKPKEEK
jgi:hypothetical protein